MNFKEHIENRNEHKTIGRFAHLDPQLQEKIKRYLEVGDFRSAKVLYDLSLESSED